MDENKKFCPYCDFVIDKDCEVCPHCGNKGKKGKSKYTAPIAALLIIVAFVLYFPLSDAFEQYHAKKEYEQTLQNVVDGGKELEEEILNAEGIDSEEPADSRNNYAENLEVLLESEAQQATYSFDTPFMFDNLEIVIGSDVKLTEVDNQFSDLNGKETIAIPISVTNKSDELHGLNMFNYKVYGSQGLELEMVGSYFDDNIDYVGDMRPGATANGYIYALYDGDGDYYIYFDNYVEQVEVKLPLSK